MKVNDTVFVMAGAREAHEVIAGLVARGKQVIAYLPEPERMFGPLPVVTKIGGLETSAAFDDWVAARHVGLVIDASHAFDAEISAQIRGVAEAQNLPYLRVLRKPWQAGAGDKWHFVHSVREAAKDCPAQACVLSNTGWPTIAEYAGYNGRLLYMRQTHAPRAKPPFAFMQFLQGTPPFSVEEEVVLFRELGVTHLICRNTGGAASQSKLLAARALSLPVFMIARAPLEPTVPVVETAAAALAWDKLV